MTALPSGYGTPAGLVANPSITSEGVGGVVNELLVQMQSFDEPTGLQKLRTKFVDMANLYLPAHRQLRRPEPPATNLLLIAATNRADNLDPALLRPGRFDRRLTFELPAKAGRREIIDHYLGLKSHASELDTEDRRDSLAAATQGYTPVMIEHLLDEALVNAVRRGDSQMSWADVERARLVEEVGMGQPVAYTDARAQADRHARGRARDGRLPGGSGTAPRGAHHHQAPVRAGHAGARGCRRGLHPLPHRDAGADPDRPGRPVRRGDLLR